jgi:hypothetical protein
VTVASSAANLAAVSGLPAAHAPGIEKINVMTTAVTMKDALLMLSSFYLNVEKTMMVLRHCLNKSLSRRVPPLRGLYIGTCRNEFPMSLSKRQEVMLSCFKMAAA